MAETKPSGSSQSGEHLRCHRQAGPASRTPGRIYYAKVINKKIDRGGGRIRGKKNSVAVRGRGQSWTRRQKEAAALIEDGKSKQEAPAKCTLI
jgi:hypothetical protein